MLAATKKTNYTDLGQNRRVSGALPCVKARVTAAAAAKSCGSTRNRAHGTLFLTLESNSAFISGVVHAAAAANAAAVARLAVAASAAPAAARSDWGGEVFVEFCGVNTVTNSVSFCTIHSQTKTC